MSGPLATRASALRRRLLDLAYPLGSLVGLLLLWEAAVWFFEIPLFLVPPPSLVLGETIDKFPLLLSHTLTTGYETLLAFLLSVAVGVPVAVSLVSSRPIERAAYPLLVASQAIPKVAIAPLLTIWFGFGLAPKVYIAFLIAFFPIVVSTVVGLKSVPPELIHLGRSMGFNPMQMFLKIRLPHALPSMFGGMQVAIALSLVGAIVSEFTGASAGLGYLLIVTIGTLDTVFMFAAILASIVIGVVLFSSVVWIERWAIPWHASQRLQAGAVS
jgi:NitT/TauT family transport system permease protein